MSQMPPECCAVPKCHHDRAFYVENCMTRWCPNCGAVKSDLSRKWRYPDPDYRIIPRIKGEKP